MKIEEKSASSTTQDTIVRPVDYVNWLLLTLRFFVVWHLTFAQLLLYFYEQTGLAVPENAVLFV